MRIHLSCLRASGLALLLGMLCAWTPASEGGYVKKWIWTKKEEKKLDAIEKKVKDDSGYSVYETDEWIVQTELGSRFTAEAALFMDIYIDLFRDIFDFKTGEEVDQKPTLVIYKSRNKYLAECPIEGSRGVFTCGWDGDGFTKFHLLTYMEESRLMSFSNCYHPVILHEATHAMMQKMAGLHKHHPAWLNEGMATFFEYWDCRSDGRPTGSSKKDKEARRMRLTLSRRKGGLRDYMRDRGGEYPRLAYVVGLDSFEKWSPDNMGPITGAHYGLAESLADYMITDKKGRELLKTIFKRFAAGESPLVNEEEIAYHEPRWWEFLTEVWGVPGKKPKD